MIEPIGPRLERAREGLLVRVVRNESQCAAQGAGAVQRALGTAQHLDLLEVIQLEITVDGRIADIRAHRILFERSKTPRWLSGRIDAANDGSDGPGEPRAKVVHAETRYGG